MEMAESSGLGRDCRFLDYKRSKQSAAARSRIANAGCAVYPATVSRSSAFVPWIVLLNRRSHLEEEWRLLSFIFTEFLGRKRDSGLVGPIAEQSRHLSPHPC